MEVFKWILFFATLGLCIYLLIDTTIWAVKKIKAKKQAKLEQQNKDVNDKQ